MSDFASEALGNGEVFALEFDEEMEYKIVGSTEADSLQGKISNESLVGQHLIGQKTGTIVEIIVPDGTLHYKITNISR